MGFDGEGLIGWIFVDFGGETVEVRLAVPGPAIGDGLGAADGHGRGEDVAVGVVVGEIIFGVLDCSSRVSDI